MARKQNGFGNPKSLSFKNAGRTDKGYKPLAAGTYPSDRRFGSSINRTIIEQYDLDSTWTRWRRGYEYYAQGAWYRLEDYDPVTKTYTDAKIESKIYQGTDFEVDVTFDGYKFATQNADSNNHYVLKRTLTKPVDIGTVAGIYNDTFKYSDNRARNELWVTLNPGKDIGLLPVLQGERITDGETEATLAYALTEEELPVRYLGKPQELTEVRVFFNPRTVLGNLPSDPQDLVGKIIYVKQFFNNKPLTDFDSVEFIDDSYFFYVNTEDTISPTDIEVYDPGDTTLPPAMYDLTTLPTIFTSSGASANIIAKQVFDKSKYQRFYGKQYMSADLVESKINEAAYTVLPFRIQGVKADVAQWELFGTPFATELQLFDTPARYAVFSDFSFTKITIDEYDGVYYHKLGKPGEDLWRKLDIDIDPWMDQVFTSGEKLTLATVYTCSCPNHSKAQLRMPQASQDDNTRKMNRQRRYPMPSAKSPNDYDNKGIDAAGYAQSWETPRDKAAFKMCKHSVAAMFIERLKVKEPNTYPTVDARLKFEEKLAADISEVAAEFRASYKRGGITTLEIIFALARGLNLDDTELAYVLLNSNF